MAVTNYKLGGLSNTNLFSYSPGGQKSKTDLPGLKPLLTNLCPSSRLRKRVHYFVDDCSGESLLGQQNIWSILLFRLTGSDVCLVVFVSQDNKKMRRSMEEEQRARKDLEKVVRRVLNSMNDPTWDETNLWDEPWRPWACVWARACRLFEAS